MTNVSRLVMIVSLGFVVGCGGQQPTDDTPTSAAQTPAAVQGSPTTTAINNADIQCEQVLPPDVTGALQGYTASTKQSCPNCPRECSYAKADLSDSLSVSFDCRVAAGPEAIDVARESFGKRGMKEEAGLGKAGFVGSPMTDMTQVSFFDDDTPCTVTITAMGEQSPKAQEIARSVDAYVTSDRLN